MQEVSGDYCKVPGAGNRWHKQAGGTHHISDQEQDTCQSMGAGMSTHLYLSRACLEVLPRRLRDT